MSLQATVTPASLITVAVIATDPLTSEGATAYLRSCPQIELVPATDRRADIVLVMAGGRAEPHPVRDAHRVSCPRLRAAGTRRS